MNIPLPTRRTTALTQITAIAALALTLLAPPAPAATYTIDACQRPDGSYVAPDGWVPGIRGDYVHYADSCSQGGPLEAMWNGTIAHRGDDFALWGFTAPPGTRIRGLVAHRTATVGKAQDYGTPQALLLTDRPIEVCDATVPCAMRDGLISTALGDASSLTFGVRCSGASGCPAGGETRYSMRQIELTLSDDSSPVISGAPGGTLMSETTRVRHRGLSYQAADVGGGVYRQRLLADGKEVAVGTVDDNAGKCVKVGRSFGHRVPCKLNASGTIGLDTAALADGGHDLTLEVYDATQTNRTTYGPWSIVADTRPPSIGEITVAGTPRAGEALKGAATVDGQNPTISYQWLRATADGSDAQPISGATTATYHLTTGDVGHKVLLEVAATDGGGTSKRATTPTDPPFTGRTVAPCEDDAACKAAAAANAAAASGPGTIAAANPVRDAGANGSPADGEANITASLQRGSRTTSRLVARYAERVRVRGKITSPSGAPIRGAVIFLMERRHGAPETAWTPAAQTRSTADGSITAFARRGRTRDLRLVYFPHGGANANRASNLLVLIARQDALLRISRRSLRNGHTLRFRGTVRGTIPRAGALVRLQVKLRTGWLTFKRLTVTTRAHGRFTARYTFRRTTTRTRYRFRVKVVPRSSSSYATGYSTSRSVVVRP
jgi:hypothetical protein